MTKLRSWMEFLPARATNSSGIEWAREWEMCRISQLDARRVSGETIKQVQREEEDEDKWIDSVWKKTPPDEVKTTLKLNSSVKRRENCWQRLLRICVLLHLQSWCSWRSPFITHFGGQINQSVLRQQRVFFSLCLCDQVIVLPRELFSFIICPMQCNEE